MNHKTKKLLTLAVLGTSLFNSKVVKADYSTNPYSIPLTYSYASDSVNSSPIQIKTAFRDPSCASLPYESLLNASISYTFGSNSFTVPFNSISGLSCVTGTRITLHSDYDASVDSNIVREFCQKNGAGTHWAAFTIDGTFKLNSTYNTRSSSATTTLHHISGTTNPTLSLNFDVTCDMDK